VVLLVELFDEGDQIKAKRVYARFRKKDPRKGPSLIDGTPNKKYILTGRVECHIESPLRKKI